MDFGYFGIIDIVFVILALIVIIVGYKKGFMQKAIGMIGLLAGLAVAFIFCKQFASWLEEMGWIYPTIFERLKTNVLELDIFADLSETTATTKDVLVAMNIPEFLADFFAKSIVDNISVEEIAINIATFFTDIIMTVISFVILFILVFVGALLLKLITVILRGNAIIRFFDGLLGVVLYFALFMVVIYVAFAIVKLLYPQDFFLPVKEFLDIDMKLADENAFRISKYFYEHNIVYAFFDILF